MRKDLRPKEGENVQRTRNTGPTNTKHVRIVLKPEGGRKLEEEAGATAKKKMVEQCEKCFLQGGEGGSLRAGIPLYLSEKKNTGGETRSTGEGGEGDPICMRKSIGIYSWGVNTGAILFDQGGR